MRASPDIGARARELEALLEEKLGLRKGAFPARVKRAGRQIPKWVHREAAVINEALTLNSHPKLRHRIDPARVQSAHDRIRQYLNGIDPADRRLGLILGMLGALAFNLLLFAVLVLGFLRWQGLI
ncbi:hypothetical protein [Aquicoccus sp.]|uniref:hypothetical protein n=1 Tax=Aquicoccus sp. TaxID=2055851 RepID=UPI003564932F